MIEGTLRRNLTNTLRSVSIFILYALFFKASTLAVGINIEGRTHLDGVPTGIIRDVEVVNDILYVASENGVFEVVGNYAKKISFNSENDSTGIISDIAYDPRGYLYIAEYAVGLFRVNLKTRESTLLFKESEWSDSVWSLAISNRHLALSVIDGVIIIDLDAHQQMAWPIEIEPGTLSGAYSVYFTALGNLLVASDDLVVNVDIDRRIIEKVSSREAFPELSSFEVIAENNGKIYLAGSEGVYKFTEFGGELTFIPFPSSYEFSTGVGTIDFTRDGGVWIGAGSVYILQDQTLTSPHFLNPVLSSDSISTVTSIKQLSDDSLVLASSQLGLIYISNAQRSINYLHDDEIVLRTNVLEWGVNENNEINLNSKLGYFETTNAQGELIKSDRQPFGQATQCIDYTMVKFEALLQRQESKSGFCESEYNHIVHVDDTSYYAYSFEESDSNFYLVHKNEIVDKLSAPDFLVSTLVLSSGELVSYDSYDSLYIQLSKYNWKKISASEGGWQGLTCIVEFSNSFYICTSGSGLKSVEIKKGTLIQSDLFGVKDLRFIRGGYVSEFGNFWLATNMGLYVYSKAQRKTFSVGKSEGVLDIDFEYYSFIPREDSLIVLGDKYIYTIDEVSMVSEMAKKFTNNGRVIFAAINWTNSRGEEKEYFPEFSQVPFVLHSDFREVTFKVSHSLGNNTNESHVQFRVQGIFDEWITQKSSHLSVTLSDIGSGDYILEARPIISGSKGEISRLNLTIHPPFYASNMAFSFYAIALVLLFTVAKLGYLKPAVSFVRDTRIYQFLTRYELTDGQSKFEKMLRAKEQHIGDIAHELKTPLQLMFNTIENKKGVNGLEDATLTAMHENAKRIQNLVEQISSTAPSISSGVAIYKLYDVEKVKYVVTSLAPLADVKKQQLDVTVKGSSGISLINDSLEKIVTNLVENAIKYTPEGGHIKVSAVLKQDSLRIVVSDNGEGIAENDHAKVLNRFARAHKGKEKGEGVGLALVNDLVKLNQGTMVLDSALSKGTKWIITLPLDDVDFINEEQSTGAKSKAWGERKTLLLIDDNRVFRTYLFNYFSDTYRCLIAKNGKQALSILKNYPVDLIISDLLMAPTNGIEFVQKLRHKPELASVPVIILTANTDEDAKRKALEAKVDHYLTKPVDNDELRLHVERLLSLRSIPHMQGRKLPQLGESLAIPELTSEKDMNFYLNFIEVLEKNYKNEYFSRDMAASMLTMSSRSLNRRLSELFEYNFSEFLTRFRVDKSIPLLLNGTTVIDACMEVGFGTPSYFSTSFKRVKGLPPRKFVDTKKVGENAPSAS